jgi:hypothetical protein
LPPDPFDLQCNFETWPADKPIIRAHDSTFGATEFNPGRGSGRFHPLVDCGSVIPTLYGSNSFDGALSETVFHDVPVRRLGKTIQQPTLLPMVSSTLLPQRPLRLVQLKGFGLAKLELTRGEIIESGLDQYPATRAWAAALYVAASDADGLIWMSRQHDASEAIMLFGTRVQRHELVVAAPPRSLHPPHDGWHDVVAAAEAAGITIVTTD